MFFHFWPGAVCCSCYCLCNIKRPFSLSTLIYANVVFACGIITYTEKSVAFFNHTTVCFEECIVRNFLPFYFSLHFLHASYRTSSKVLLLIKSNAVPTPKLFCTFFKCCYRLIYWADNNHTANCNYSNSDIVVVRIHLCCFCLLNNFLSAHEN